MKQPRVPEYRERAGASAYLKTLVMFLKDFTMATWEKLERQEKEIEDLKNLVSKGSEIDG